MAFKKVRLLREILDQHSEKKKIILDTNNCDVFYCKPHKISSQVRRLLNHEVLDYETSKYDDWIEIWLK